MRLDSGFHALDSGSHGLDFGFQGLDSGFQRQKNVGFQIPDSLTWGDSHTELDDFKFCSVLPTTFTRTDTGLKRLLLELPKR